MTKFHIRVFFVLLFIVGMYTGVSLNLGDMPPIPAFIAGIAGVVLLILNYKYVRAQHLQLFLLLIILMIPGIISNAGDGFEVQRLKGIVQLPYSMAISFALFLELSKWDRNHVENLFYWITLLILIGCFLEDFTGFKEVSDNFRSYTHTEKHTYEAITRDEAIFGRERPKLFTSEPSYVALFLLLSITMWYSLTEKKNAKLGLFIFAVIGMLLIGSPILVLAFAVPVINLLFLNEEKRKFNNRNIWKWVKVLLIVILVGAFFFATVNTVLKDRFEQVTAGRDDSFSGRITAPPMIAFTVLSDYPMFGIGINAKNKIGFVALDVFKGLGTHNRIKDIENFGDFVTNAFWLHWIYLGLLGGVLLVYWMYILMKVLRIKHKWYCFILTIIDWQTTGGYVDPRTWFFFFMLMVVSVLSTYQLKQYKVFPPMKKGIKFRGAYQGTGKLIQS